ncbi:unnamed protein product, partial [Prorocentrum cordatum]
GHAPSALGRANVSPGRASRPSRGRRRRRRRRRRPHSAWFPPVVRFCPAQVCLKTQATHAVAPGVGIFGLSDIVVCSLPNMLSSSFVVIFMAAPGTMAVRMDERLFTGLYYDTPDYGPDHVAMSALKDMQEKEKERENNRIKEFLVHSWQAMEDVYRKISHHDNPATDLHLWFHLKDVARRMADPRSPTLKAAVSQYTHGTVGMYRSYVEKICGEMGVTPPFNTDLWEREGMKQKRGSTMQGMQEEAIAKLAEPFPGEFEAIIAASRGGAASDGDVADSQEIVEARSAFESDHQLSEFMIEAALDCLDSYEDKSSLVQVSEGSGNASQLQTVGRNEFVAVFKAIAGLVLTIIKKSAMLVGWVIQELGNLFKKKAAPSLTSSCCPPPLEEGVKTGRVTASFEAKTLPPHLERIVTDIVTDN